MKGQRVAHITQVACFQSALKIPRFICPKMFFGRCLVEVIVLSRDCSFPVANDRCWVLILKFR